MYEEELGFLLVAVLIILALGLSFAIGANDETPAPLAGAGTVKFKYVLIIGGVGLTFGMIFLSEGVASMVGEGILGPGIKYSIYMLLAVLISSILWLIIGSFAGIPLSSTHSLIGSIFGVVIVYALFVGNIDISTAFNWDKLGGVVLSWVISPIVGLVVTFVMYKIVAKFILSKKKGLNDIEKSEHKFSIALLLAVFLCSVYTGANSAEALGMLYGLHVSGEMTIEMYYFWVVICGIVAFFGVFIAGRFVIKNLATQMTDSRPSDGFIITLSSALILMFCTVFFSVPISHSHVVVFCIIGLNIAQKKEVDYKGIGKMSIFWVITFPVAAIAAGFFYLGFISFGLY